MDRKEYYRQWKERNREKLNAYYRNYYHKPENRLKATKRHRKHVISLKLYFIDLLGKKCLNCGLFGNQDNYVVFEFHHINQKDKEIEAEFRIHPQKFEKIIKEGKIELYCSNCHKLKHHKEKMEILG